jgi:YfiR/HmsC-like
VTAAIAVCASTSFASAQTATAPALKAAFLYNFAKFTEWPADALAPGEPLLLCVINDRAVGETLVDLTKGRNIEGHALVVSTMKPDSAVLTLCGVIYTSGLGATRSSALLESVAGKPILTVSDLDNFAQLGGVAGFFVEKGTMRFAINLDAAQRGGIHLSSKLLSLARIVKDDRNAARR